MSILVCKNINRTLSVMLDELRDECLRCIKLINQLELDNLTEEQVDEILGDLTASVAHLNIHSETVKEELDKQ